MVNDDGIDANGIKTLIRTLAKEKEFNVCVVAPERERSASGHCITVHEPIGVKRLSDYYHDDAYNDDDENEQANERKEEEGQERLNLDKMKALMNDQQHDEKLEQTQELAEMRANVSLTKQEMSDASKRHDFGRNFRKN